MAGGRHWWRPDAAMVEGGGASVNPAVGSRLCRKLTACADWQ
jgi:hypothetical protein